MINKKLTWFERNKKLVFILLILTILLIVSWYHTSSMVQSYLPELQLYAKTKQYSEALQPVGIALLVTFIISGLWILDFVILMIKTIFPTKKAFKSALALSEADDLKKMLLDIRRGIGDNE
ncbi:TPA: hypothetical protein ACP0O4_001678 [Streptococcus pyogenes]